MHHREWLFEGRVVTAAHEGDIILWGEEEAVPDFGFER
jgi:hypothetical protein